MKVQLLNMVWIVESSGVSMVSAGYLFMAAFVEGYSLSIFSVGETPSLVYELVGNGGGGGMFELVEHNNQLRSNYIYW